MFGSLLSVLAFAATALGISVTTSTSSYVVDSASSDGFKVTFSRSTCDITSILYRSTQYQYTSTYSHIASGLGSATVSYKTVDNYVVVTCVAKNSDFDLTQYFVFEDATSLIYMGTYTNSEPTIGELRFIYRLTGLVDAYKEGDVSDTSGGTAIEASDVYLVNGETRSKFYSSERFIDDDVYCAVASDSSVHACYVSNVQSREKSSGGPFFRDINLNEVGSYQSVTYYMNSGHVPTESYRMGFHGPYTMSFSRSGIPKASEIDTSFFADLGLTGYVGASGRGTVTGKASGVSTSLPIVVHWYNDNYQNWITASSSGTFTSPPLVAGTYTMALYQDEFLAGTTSVTVTAGGSVTKNIAATSTVITGSHTTVFKIGEYDGQPFEFLNGDKFLRMHPSDSRMSSWSPGTFTVGTTATTKFPMALFKSVNSPQALTFTLPAAISTAATFRIATTIDSRGVTRGAYRGYGNVYDCTIPAGNLVEGTNTISISTISGSSGTDFLSPNFIFDAIELFY
ncbi:related to rhamnogalacturonase B precursor [Phialocephala subalpina]|uniref:rhamnogalacturonan endolyase n=1 Tax=Phialocephala subalpina TaxID=576137 RepID=A0A1L7WVR3_9HELO|nr:related to rhamnogalacturonase B precursor [Phialocephala subalpina]